MTLSPPLSVLAILAAAMMVTAWIAPEPSSLKQVTVNLSPGAYNELANQAQRRRTVEGTQMTVSGIIEEKLFTPCTDLKVISKRSGNVHLNNLLERSRFKV